MALSNYCCHNSYQDRQRRNYAVPLEKVNDESSFLVLRGRIDHALRPPGLSARR